ncbi:prolyl-tRNA synthetase [uncultured delta proteobacterium]|uniref:Proline--tRNA ligase n=1 Tax=uncultured delta proteobacterium TaxID=34034 RepID=A0A212J031_9DELT|nr:prolyl-tRNA synthetase [uncultured delta proteobacterium]
MRFSQYFIPTLKEAPADAEVVSHKLLIRAGMIRRLTSGIYDYLPLGLKSIRKIETVVREEMNRAGALEMLMPTVQPADLWQESGRWDHYGKELLRFRDRHDRDYCLGPTHEEVITDMVRKEIKSYRQMPVNFYQIQGKFRDEIRPRFGLMRGREFIMKDAYSFDRDDAGADKSYKAMYDAYIRIFERLALKFKPVEADSGSIGGSFSHEFMVLAETGEDVIASCSACAYAANVERAVVLANGQKDNTEPPACTVVDTLDKHSVEEVAAFLKVAPAAVVKTILLNADGKSVAALVRGDRELNIPKIKNLLHADAIAFATPEEVTAWTGAPVGYAGPVNLAVTRVIADNELGLREGWVTGANKGNTHLVNVSLARDATIAEYADIRMIAEGDPCPACGGKLEFPRGIEVGHVFKLGTKYSEALRAVYLDENGKEQTTIMGCYGIGITRVLAACIEQNNDEGGIVFPPPVAPFHANVLNLDPKSADANAKADEIVACLEKQGLEVLLDDRDERPGIKFKDADLIGIPLQLVIGGKGLARGVIEAKDRRTNEKTELPVDGFAEAFAAWKTTVYAGWNM